VIASPAYRLSAGARPGRRPQLQLVCGHQGTGAAVITAASCAPCAETDPTIWPQKAAARAGTGDGGGRRGTRRELPTCPSQLGALDGCAARAGVGPTRGGMARAATAQRPLSSQHAHRAGTLR